MLCLHVVVRKTRFIHLFHIIEMQDTNFSTFFKRFPDIWVFFYFGLSYVWGFFLNAFSNFTKNLADGKLVYDKRIAVNMTN